MRHANRFGKVVSALLLSLTFAAADAAAAPAIHISCGTDYMDSSKSAALGAPTVQRSCSLGIKFALKSNPQATTNRVASCMIKPGSSSCAVTPARLNLPANQEWIPVSAWTEKIITPTELNLGCVYAEGYPLASAYDYRALGLPASYTSYYFVKAQHRYDCLNPVSQPTFDNVAPPLPE